VQSFPLTEKARIVYDPDLKGFGVRVLPPTPKNRNGTKTWIVEYRPGSGGRRVSKRRISLGSVDLIAGDVARTRAQKILAEVRVSGSDPALQIAKARQAAQLDELRERYFRATNPYRKPRTRELYEGLWRIHIGPSIGSTKVDQVNRNRVAELHSQIGTKHPATANRVVLLLSNFFEWAREASLVEFEANPARGIKKFKLSRRERFLSVEEFARLGRAITTAEIDGIPWEPDPAKKIKHAPRAENRRVTISRHSAAALRLLIFTGARLREILHLTWSEVDLDRGLLLLPDSKTGRKTIILPAPALEILRELQDVRSKEEGARFVIEGDDPSKPRADLQRPWKLVRDAAQLEGFRLHDLRHSFASVGAALNLGLPVIGELLGHTDPATTARYAHLAVEPLRAASDGIAKSIKEMMNARA
jgi:integrase